MQRVVISMMDFNLNKQQMSNLKKNISTDAIKQAKEIEKALKTGQNVDQAMSNFTPEQRQTMQNILSNKDALNNFMKSEQAQNLLRKLTGDNK